MDGWIGLPFVELNNNNKTSYNKIFLLFSTLQHQPNIHKKIKTYVYLNEITI